MADFDALEPVDDGEILYRPSVQYENRKSRQAIEWRFLLAHRLCLRVEGPAHSPM